MLGRLGRWCFRRRWWVLAIWLLAMVAGVLSAGPVFHGLTGGGGPKSLESVAANQVLADAADRGGTVVAVIDRIQPAASGVDTVVRAAADDLPHVSGGGTVATPYDTRGPKAKTGAVFSAGSVMTVLLAFSTFPDLDNNTVTVVTLLALGLSIDYGLLLVGRYREELGGGYAPEVAITRAWATAGRTILFSALTVAAALSGLLLLGIAGLSALGAAGVSIAVVAMLVSLTFTGALLGVAQRWIKPSKPAAPRIAPYGDAAEVGFFARLARTVQPRPPGTPPR